MARVSRTALVPYSAQQMFDLINDIESYPDFMAGCVGAEVLESAHDWIEARLTLGVSGVQQSFVTRNELLPPKQMKMYLVEGPFSQFEGAWTFNALSDEGCKVGLELDFALSNPLLAMTIGKVLEDMASRQVDSLCQRADKIYA